MTERRTRGTPKPKAQPAAEKPRGGPARRVADLVPAIGGAAFRRFGFVQSSVVSRWGEIVGEKFSRFTRPESIRFPQGKRQDGVLSVVVTGAHAPMLQHVAPEIVERVNRFFGYPAVARLAIRQGVVEVAPRPVPRAPAPPPAELGDSLRSVGDPELRAVLSALAAGVAASEKRIPVLGKVK